MPGPFFWFFALVALVTIIMAVRFAFRPSERGLAMLRPMCAATIFAALASFLLGIANALMGMSAALERTTDPAVIARLWRTFMSGLAESPGPLILAFAGVSVAWLLVAVGLRRQA